MLLKNWKFRCESCNHEDRFSRWSNEIIAEKCTKCGSISHFCDYEEKAPVFQIMKKTKGGRGLNEARSRSLKNFKEDIYPTLPVTEKLHFKKKHGW